MSIINSFLLCLTSPRLKKIYRQNYAHVDYKPNNLEAWSDSIINSIYFVRHLGFCTSLFICGMMYKRGFTMNEVFCTTSKYFVGVTLLVAVSICVRSLGRFTHPEYLSFLNNLSTVQKDLKKNKKILLQYDFDFSAWPVEFRWSDVETPKKSIQYSSRNSNRTMVEQIIQLPLDVIGYIAISTFGIRLIYPGSLGFIQALLDQNLVQGRASLVERHKGERFKLGSRDNNDVDVMFVDKRNIANNSSIGNTLVICSEGNAGFYEIGLMCTPLDCGYSVLGWNHPGFAGSTGKPYPGQEQSSIDVIMQFAIHKLGFAPENIILFGWSIGGYATSWAAMNYPDVKGVVLDASFDDLVPLALEHTPAWTARIVVDAVTKHVNLNVAEQLCQYPGPVLLIRRSQDEIICTRPGDISSNRGNDLLLKLLQHRYPLIFAQPQLDLAREYLGVSGLENERMLSKFGVEEEHCTALIQSYVLQESKSFPMMIGERMTNDEKNKLTLFLIRKYLIDFNSTHCSALPAEYLQTPWDISTIEADFVVVR